MRIFLTIVFMCLAMVQSLCADDSSTTAPDQNSIPPFLYKVLSAEDWQASQSSDRVKLPERDKNFIRLATERQVNWITKRQWKHASEYMVLKIDTKQLPGRLVFESNYREGGHKSYHLYDGYIPLKAVVEAKQITNTESSSSTTPSTSNSSK